MTYNIGSSIQPVLYVIPEINFFKTLSFCFEHDILHQLDSPSGAICVKYLRKCHRIFVYIGSHLTDLICRCKNIICTSSFTFFFLFFYIY